MRVVIVQRAQIPSCSLEPPLRQPIPHRAGRVLILAQSGHSASFRLRAYHQLNTLDRHGHPSDRQALPSVASLIDLDRQENSPEVHKL
jgi:hypothetical protein